MSKANTVMLTLILVTPKTAEELKQIIIRLSKTPDVDKIEQVFPDARDPVLTAICVVYVQAPKVDSVLKSLLADSDVESAQITPRRKVQKRKK